MSDFYRKTDEELIELLEKTSVDLNNSAEDTEQNRDIARAILENRYGNRIEHASQQTMYATWIIAAATIVNILVLILLKKG